MNIRPQTSDSSPFLAMPAAWRLLFVTYLLLYDGFFPILAALSDPDAAPLLLPRFFLQFVYILLVCWPLIFYRREYGFLHPLILPALLAMFENVAKYPLHLIAPFAIPLVDYGVPTNSTAVSLQMSLNDLAFVRLWYEAVQILSLICYYIGYFGLNIFKVPALRFYPPQNLSVVCPAAAGLCVMVALVYVQFASGGLANYLVAMRSGRQVLFEGQGEFLTIGTFSVVIALVWFMYLRNPFANPLWLGTFAVTGLTTLVVGGARSDLAYAIVTLLLLWWRRANRVLLAPSIALAFATILIFGIFGSIRQDWRSQSIDTSVFGLSQVSQELERAQAEFVKREDEETDVAAFAGASNGLLWGRTYLEAISFWIPRAIWPNKPHGAGAYNMWVNFTGRPLAQFGSGTFWGMPVRPATEAYWNFFLPGVIIVFLMYGAFHRWLSKLVWRYPNSPAALIFSTWMVTHFIGDSATFVTAARDAILLVVLYYMLGIVRPGVRRARLTRAPALARLGRNSTDLQSSG